MAEETKAENTAPVAPEGGGGSGMGGKIIGIVLPAVFAGGAAFAGAFLAKPGHHPAAAPTVDASAMPGPNVPLKPFTLAIQDEKTGDNRPMKLVISIELAKESKKEELDPFVPAIRDTVIGYLRSQTFQDINNPKKKDKITEDLLDLIHKKGATIAKHVWIEDMVSQ
jgi:flagellar basal body-associated protein FliL